MKWPTKKLGEICKENKKSPFKVENADNIGPYPFFTSGGNVLKHSEYLVDGENIFLSTGGYAHIKYYNGKAGYSADTWCLKVKNAVPKFVYYQILRKIKFIDEILFRGTGLRHLQKKEFLKLEILSPPLPIQQKIVSILDTIQSAIEIQNKIIEKTKELKKSMMAELFKLGGPSFRKNRKLKQTEIGKIPEDWQVVRLGEVVEEIEQKNPANEPYKEIKYIDVSSIDNKFFKIIEFKKFKGEEAPSRARKIVKTGDVIFATVRPYLKRIALVSEIFNGGFCSTAFCVIRPQLNKLNSYFTFTYLTTDIFVNRVSNYQHGSGYPAISDRDVYNEKIPLPPLPEQREIAKILQTVDQKIEIEQNKKELYEELFKTVLNKIMNQEIDVEKIEVYL